MPFNRITAYTKMQPQPNQPSSARAAFVALPYGLIASMNPQQVAWQQQLYRVAYERAREQSRPARHHRLLAAWN